MKSVHHMIWSSDGITLLHQICSSNHVDNQDLRIQIRRNGERILIQTNGVKKKVKFSSSIKISKVWRPENGINKNQVKKEKRKRKQKSQKLQLLEISDKKHNKILIKIK